MPAIHVLSTSSRPARQEQPVKTSDELVPAGSSPLSDPANYFCFVYYGSMSRHREPRKGHFNYWVSRPGISTTTHSFIHAYIHSPHAASHLKLEFFANAALFLSRLSSFFT